MDDEDRMKFETDEFYLKSPEEMHSLFDYAPEALENTVRIAERCRLELEFGKTHLPKFDVPQGAVPNEYLRKLCYEGLNQRYDDITDELKDRLEYELGVIEKMGYVDYFLIVWDFIRFAREHDIMTGPGRGSAAGSIVSYALNITDLNPLDFDLLFERFLNEERISMPDIDMDFADNRREEVIQYVIEKYGADHVAQIITFGTMMARGAIRDVGRALGVSYNDVDKIAKMFPFGLHLVEAIDTVPELKNLYRTI
jgi:DNA polymerase-3 subunit alpha